MELGATTVKGNVIINNNVDGLTQTGGGSYSVTIAANSTDTVSINLDKSDYTHGRIHIVDSTAPTYTVKRGVYIFFTTDEDESSSQYAPVGAYGTFYSREFGHVELSADFIEGWGNVQKVAISGSSLVITIKNERSVSHTFNFYATWEVYV